MNYFNHKKLDVYQAALEFALLADEIGERFPLGRSYLTDQLRRAGASILLNIAEGSGEFSDNERIRFYRIARRSATECAAILDLGDGLNLIESEQYLKGCNLLLRIIAMLTRMTRKSINSPLPSQSTSSSI